MLKVKDKAKVAELFISGDIVDDRVGGSIQSWREGDTTGYEFPTKLKAQLDAVKDKPLEVHINSYGGSVFAGMAMANFIANHKAHTTAIIDGIAASIASQIFLSADECKMPSNAYLMIHKPFSVLEGNAEDFRKAAEVLDTLQKGLEVTYNKKAREGVTADDIHELMNAETWFTGDEAAKTFKVELLSPVTISNAVELKPTGFKNIPAALTVLTAENQIKIALAKSRAFL